MRALNNSYSSRHHLEFLSRCLKDHLMPKGLRLHLKVNVVGSDHKELDQNILKTAESDILTLLTDHYKTEGDTHHREANSIKQKMEILAARLPEQERLQHAQEVDFTERRAQIRTREQETTRLKKHTALHHERIVNPEATRTAPPMKRARTTTQQETPMDTDGSTTPNPEPTLQLRSRSVPKPKTGTREVFQSRRKPPRTSPKPNPTPTEGQQNPLPKDLLQAIKPFLKSQYQVEVPKKVKRL